MTALQEWQTWIKSCSKERGEADDKVWQRLATWYPHWAQHNDYVELVCPRLLQVIDSTGRVLEVGPGSGAFTLPLAAVAREVVAVEPSPAMAAVLTQRLAEAGLNNVRLVPQSIETGLAEIEGCFDLALASHSLYQVAAIDKVMSGLTSLTRHVVILMGTGEERDWYQALHRRFKGKERPPFDYFKHFYPVLLEMGIYADVEIIWTSSNYVYESEEAMVEWWLQHFQLDETYRLELQSALGRIAEARSPYIGIYEQRRSALIWIDRTRNIKNGDSFTTPPQL